MDYIDEIYYTLMDDLTEEAAIPWVEPIWADGDCRETWEAMCQAQERLCARLGREEDTDVEALIDALLRIQRLAARRMFLYGMRLRNEQEMPRT